MSARPPKQKPLPGTPANRPAGEADAEKRYFAATRRGDWRGALEIAMAEPATPDWMRRRTVASKVVAGAFLPREGV